MLDRVEADRTGHVRDTFLSAVEAYTGWDGTGSEPLVGFEVKLRATPNSDIEGMRAGLELLGYSAWQRVDQFNRPRHQPRPPHIRRRGKGDARGIKGVIDVVALSDDQQRYNKKFVLNVD